MKLVRQVSLNKVQPVLLQICDYSPLSDKFDIVDHKLCVYMVHFVAICDIHIYYTLVVMLWSQSKVAKTAMTNSFCLALCVDKLLCS